MTAERGDALSHVLLQRLPDAVFHRIRHNKSLGLR
jgi:hypothetical protein